MKPMTTVRLNVTLLPPIEPHTFVEVQLDRYDVDNAIYVPTVRFAYFDSEGYAALDIWPNERGVRDSRYRVRIASPARTLLASQVTVPDRSPVNLRELLRDDSDDNAMHLINT